MHPVPVIGGAPRSGTTLLRMILDSHPHLAIPPETGFLLVLAEAPAGSLDDPAVLLDRITHFPADAPNWVDFDIDAADLDGRWHQVPRFTAAAGVRDFFRCYATRRGKPRWGDKTPANSREFARIQQVLPETRCIHMIRDGRDVAASLQTMWFSPGESIEVRAAHWRDWVTRARAQGERCPHYLEVRYEDLVRDPEGTTRRVCDFIELPFDPAMLAYHHRSGARLAEHRDRRRADGSLLVSHTERLKMQQGVTGPPDPSRAGAWRRTWSTEESDRFTAVAGDLLAELGYD